MSKPKKRKKNINDRVSLVDDIVRLLRTPRDWNKMDNTARADTLVLSFIGYVARPKNIPHDVLEKCIEAFNNNRGKVERETEAVLKVLEL